MVLATRSELASLLHMRGRSKIWMSVFVLNELVDFRKTAYEERP